MEKEFDLWNKNKKIIKSFLILFVIMVKFGFVK